MFRITVHRSGNKACISTHGQRQWIKRVIDASEWCRFCDFVFLRGWRILPFGQAINLVIKQKNIYVKVSAKQVNSVVTTNAQAIPVACDYPYTQLWPGSF